MQNVGLEQLKLSKSLHNSMQELGWIQAKEVQVKSISRIAGGQSFVLVAPPNSGKTTAYILGVLMRLKYSQDEAPKVLILVKDSERGEEVIERFKQLSGNRGLRITGLFGTGGMEAEISELMEGVDVVVATPARARAVYLKLALNVNKLQTFIIDDADEQLIAGQQLPIHELARSAGKCQYLVYTSVYTKKLATQLSLFWEDPEIIEIKEEGVDKTQVSDFTAYDTPNFQTKINLLHYNLSAGEMNRKTILFVNSKLTARNLYKEIAKYNPQILQPIDSSQNGVEHILDFMENSESNLLVVAHESNAEIDMSFMPSMIHIEVCQDFKKLIYLMTDVDQERLIHFYVSDSEMIVMKQLENAIGGTIEFQDLPTELSATKSKKKAVEDVGAEDTAFHKKKESNSKNFNFGIGDKIKMNKKKKYG